MADGDEQLVEELVGHLQELGLTEYEARTLVALVRLGTATAKQVADADRVPRTRVYEAAESLHEMGLVDIQYTTPREFVAVAPEIVVTELRTTHEERLTEVAELFKRLETTEPVHEQFGVWTVSGSEAVAGRVLEFVDRAESEVVLVTVEDLLAGALLERLSAAADRGVDVHVGELGPEFRERVHGAVPSAGTFGTPWDWTTTPAGRLLVVDGEAALVSIIPDAGMDAPDEVALWGRGGRNGLVLFLRLLLSAHLDAHDSPP